MSLGRRYHLSIVILAGLLVGLAGSSVAQSSQGVQKVTVQPDMIHWKQVPEELPGTYQGFVVVRTTVSGGGCLCAPGTTTTVGLDLGIDEPITKAVVSPSSYAIDWWADPDHQQFGHDKVVKVTLHLADTGADLVKFDIETEANTNSPFQETEALSSAYAVPLPQDFHNDASEDNMSNQTSESGAPDDEDARTHSAPASDHLQQAAVPGMGAIAALIALGAVAWRRRGA